MRQQRTTAAPAPARATRAPIEPLTSGYALVVDGQMKTDEILGGSPSIPALS
jgi:hypothetical protein